MLFAALALAMMQSPSTIPDSERGHALYSQCRAVVRIVDGTAATGDIAESHLGAHVICTSGAAGAPSPASTSTTWKRIRKRWTRNGPSA